MRFPSIHHVAMALREINGDVGVGEGPDEFGDFEQCDVRLQVYNDGTWAIRVGSSDYDQDHHGYWGASCVPGGRKRFQSRDVARDLIDQARDAHAQGAGY